MNRYPFPGMLPHARTYAAWPVWAGSTSAEVRFQPMTRREARELWHRARDFERQTRKPGRQDGDLGRNGLAIVYVFTHDFLNFRSGALYPSRATIARKAAISESSVDRGLKNLKACGVINWLRRCVAAVAPAGGFLMRQISNAYALLPSTQWRGYKPPPPPPPPDPVCWGARPPEDPYAEAGDDVAARMTALEAEAAAGSGLSAVLAMEMRRRQSPANSEAVRLRLKPGLHSF